jgi:hypothetical protein
MTAKYLGPEAEGPSETIVKIDGKGKRMLKAEIYFRQLFNKAMKGSLDEY